MIDEKIIRLIDNVEIKCNVKADINATSFHIKTLKDNASYSITLGGNSLACGVKVLKSCYRLIVKKKFYSTCSNMETVKIKQNNDLIEVDFQEKNNDYYSLIELALYDAVKTYQPENRFGCCSRYLECSKEKRCVHPDLLYSKGCWYRRNIEKGIIFYK